MVPPCIFCAVELPLCHFPVGYSRMWFYVVSIMFFFLFFSFLFQSLDKEDVLSLLFYSGSSTSNIFVHLS